MAMRQPRRIFRSGSRVPLRGSIGAMRDPVVIGLIGALAGAAAVLFAVPARLLGSSPAQSGTITAEPEQVAVIDGATLRLRDTVIHLRAVDAPLRGRFCRDDDGRSFDCGAAAAEALASVVRGRTVACRLHGQDASGLPEGECESGGAELSRALVADGWARAIGGTTELADAERVARSQHRGLWRDARQAPF